MTWNIRLSREAARQLTRYPRDHQKRIKDDIDQMETDPFLGNVAPLKGKKWKGRYRKVSGRYRIIFTPSHKDRIVEISAILPRSEKTYR